MSGMKAFQRAALVTPLCVPRQQLRQQRRQAGEATGPQRMDLSKVDLGAVRLEARERSDVVGRLVEEQRAWFANNKPDYFEETTIKNPQSIREWLAKKISEGLMERSRAYNKAERSAITVLNHVTNPDWALLFGLKEMYLDLIMFLFAVHAWMLQKRAAVLPHALMHVKALHNLFGESADARLGNLLKSNAERRIMQDGYSRMYRVLHNALDENYVENVGFRDALLLSALYRNAPIEHKDEVPFYAWFVLVQYIRIHMAVLDRLSNTEFREGMFFFYQPFDNEVFDSFADLDSPRFTADLLLGRKHGAKSPKPQSDSAPSAAAR